MGKLKVCVEASEEIKGEKVAEELIKKIRKKVPNPKFILLFTTIHYKKEFKPILNGITSAFPNSPLIGGTVAGFITPENVYVRGVACFALDYPNMDVAIGYGKNTKRNPKKAAMQCAEMIREGLKDSKYKNKFLINLISGPIIPKLPFLNKRINVVKSKIIGSLLTYLGIPIFSYFGMGLGKEEDVINYLSQYLPSYKIIGGSCIDDSKYLRNYQFFNDAIKTNSIVALGISFDLHVTIDGVTGLKKINKKFSITKMCYDNRIINEINNKPAKYCFLRLLDVPEALFREAEAFYYKTTLYFPITFEQNEKRLSGAAGFFGNNIVLGYKAEGNRATILSATGKEVLNSTDKIFSKISRGLFVLALLSSIRVDLLCNQLFKVKEKADGRFNNNPYIIVFPTCENLKSNEKEKPIITIYSVDVCSVIGD